jgi:hypothetical protein
MASLGKTLLPPLELARIPWVLLLRVNKITTAIPAAASRLAGKRSRNKNLTCEGFDAI